MNPDLSLKPHRVARLHEAAERLRPGRGALHTCSRLREVATMSSESPAMAPVPVPEPEPQLSTAAARRLDEERKTALRVISNELRLLWRDPPPYCRPGPEPVTDPFHWEVVIDGPAGTPYAGGTFPVDIQFPTRYPFVRPKVTFKTLVYHPNIDEEGNMVLDDESWSCASKIYGLLVGFVSVLYDPLLDYPINYDIAEQYAYDYERYEAEARAWTREFSSAPVVSCYPPNAVVGRAPPAVPHFPATAARRRAEAEARRRAAAASSGSGESLWRRAVGYVQSWSPYCLLHRD